MQAQRIQTKAVCFLKWYSQMRNISSEGNWREKKNKEWHNRNENDTIARLLPIKPQNSTATELKFV